MLAWPPRLQGRGRQEGPRAGPLGTCSRSSGVSRVRGPTSGEQQSLHQRRQECCVDAGPVRAPLMGRILTQPLRSASLGYRWSREPPACPLPAPCLPPACSLPAQPQAGCGLPSGRGRGRLQRRIPEAPSAASRSGGRSEHPTPLPHGPSSHRHPPAARVLRMLLSTGPPAGRDLATLPCPHHACPEAEAPAQPHAAWPFHLGSACLTLGPWAFSRTVLVPLPGVPGPAVVGSLWCATHRVSRGPTQSASAVGLNLL